jgi:hypothetical protein
MNKRTAKASSRLKTGFKSKELTINEFEPAGEPVHHPRQLGYAHHTFRRQVTDVRATDHRQHVMQS